MKIKYEEFSVAFPCRPNRNRFTTSIRAATILNVNDVDGKRPPALRVVVCRHKNRPTHFNVFSSSTNVQSEYYHFAFVFELRRKLKTKNESSRRHNSVDTSRKSCVSFLSLSLLVHFGLLLIRSLARVCVCFFFFFIHATFITNEHETKI